MCIDVLAPSTSRHDGSFSMSTACFALKTSHYFIPITANREIISTDMVWSQKEAEAKARQKYGHVFTWTDGP